MKINPIPDLAQNRQIRKYMYWSTRKASGNGNLPEDNITNYKKVQKTYPKIFMVWLSAIQCYFLNKSKEMPKERKVPLLFNNLYSCVIALATGAVLGKHIDKLTKTMIKKAETVYKNESAEDKKAMINGIDTGVPFLIEAVLFQYVGPVIATPLAISTTSYLSKKGMIDLSSKSNQTELKQNKN